jgi:hypothetical protein
VLQIVFGSFGLASPLFSAATSGITRGLPGPAGEMMDAMHEGLAGTWTTIAMILGFASGGLLLAAGIGVWKRRAWGRKLSIVQAIISIVIGVTNIVLTELVIMPALERALSSLGPIARASMAGGRIGAVFGGIFAIGIPIAVLVLMTRPKAKEEISK